MFFQIEGGAQKENHLLKKYYLSCVAVVLIAILLLPSLSTFILFGTSYTNSNTSILNSTFLTSDIPDDPIPLSKMTFVAEDPDSYIDDFSYIAAIPGSIFYSAGSKYISPILYTGSTDTERWLIEDWSEYLAPDGGVSETLAIGDMSFSEIKEIQQITGNKAYPQITGASSADIAAKLAVKDWRTADTVVLALAKDSFSSPTIISDSASFSFNGASIRSNDGQVTISSTVDTEVPFSPPAGTGWMQGAFNWTGDEIFTHTLEDPNGRSVDYSVYRQVIFERNTLFVDNPVPLYFWIPLTMSGEWNMILEPRSQISSGVTVDYSITYYPGFSETITVPERAKWLNITAMWDNAGTTINLALIDPNGRLVMWAPAESLLGGAGSKSLQMPYPAPGDWSLVGAWVDPSEETNNIDIEWDIEALPSDIQPYLESASNGAVLASLLNAPLLYVNADSLPAITSWALDYLGASTCFLVDPANYHSQSIVDELDDSYFVSVLSSYSSVTNWIHNLSGEMDVVVTVPLGHGDEFFGPAAYSAAFHGASIYSLCGEDNLITTRSEETWAPYLIGPDIRIFVQNQYSTRAENGWYDERIPNTYSMEYSATSFEVFLESRGAYNSSIGQSVIIVSPTDLIKVSFDRSLQSHFACGRIPAKNSAYAAAMINRAALHRFLFSLSDNADEALLSLYAYTISSSYSDNYGNSHQIEQIDDTVSSLSSAGFSISAHVGADEVFAGVASQVALWAFSTHGTLTEYPTDPPQRPDGLGVFSLRDIDIPYGQESDTQRDVSGDSGVGIVNPVAYSPEANHHILKTTDDLEASIQNIGSPIITITACLLGGSELPVMLMKHGAVAVTAAPRTVYFRAAGLLSILFTESISAGNTTGDALAYALRVISHDYTDPFIDEPIDYANQQILFGDPDICLYNPNDALRIASVDPMTLSIDGHMPGRGVKGIAALGISDYLPNGFDNISEEYDFYDSGNYSGFLTLLDLRKTVVIEPQSLSSLSSVISNDQSVLSEFVYNGGTLVIMGVDDDISWLTWNATYQSGSSTSITILDAGHPLISIPNLITTTISSVGQFESISSNMTALALNSNGIAIAAGVFGTGKIALTTTVPQGADRDAFLENVAAWNEQESLILWDLSFSQEIIWEGDRVVLTMEITNVAGVRVAGVSVTVFVNSTEIDSTESATGLHDILFDEAWTSANHGYHSIGILATKTGYDTMSLLLINVLLIRTSPLLLILIGGSVVVALVIGWEYRKRRLGERPPKVQKRKTVPGETKEDRRKRELAEKERQRKREEEEKKFDAKEYFGVE